MVSVYRKYLQSTSSTVCDDWVDPFAKHRRNPAVLVYYVMYVKKRSDFSIGTQRCRSVAPVHSIGQCPMASQASVNSAYPAARKIAPQTPPPAANRSLAALTMQSASKSVMLIFLILISLISFAPRLIIHIVPIVLCIFKVVKIIVMIVVKILCIIVVPVLRQTGNPRWYCPRGWGTLNGSPDSTTCRRS